MNERNWLETAASWLAAPFRAVLSPWWDRLIENKAENQAVRAKLLESIIRFRVRDSQEDLKMDAHRAEGVAQRVIERLRPNVKDLSVDLSSAIFLDKIEREIEVQAVPLSAWVQLACLGLCQNFDPKQGIVVEFTDDLGNRSHASSIAFSIQGTFPFTKILALSGPNIARLSSQAQQALAAFCERQQLPETTFELANEVAISFESQFRNPQTLRRGWRPSQATG